MSDLPRELDFFLADADGEPASEEFRRRVFEQTEALLPMPRPQCRATKRIVAIAACGLLAVGLACWTWASRPVAKIESVVVNSGPVGAPEQDIEPPEPTPSEPNFSPALTMEWHAFDSGPVQQAQLYWNAGQAYVAAEGDFVSALRCYRQALETGPARMREITDEDDVLAMALKLEATHKEKRNVTP